MALISSPCLLLASSVVLVSAVWIAVLKRILHRTTGELQARLDMAAESTRYNSAFLAGLAHEIRTQLAGIRGMNSLILATDLPEQAHECLQMAQESAESLTGLLDDLLDLSRIETGRMELVNHPFCVRAAVEEAIRAAFPSAREKGLALSATVDPRIPRHLDGDAARLRQVLLILLRTAIRFSDNGKIHVQAQFRGVSGSTARLEFFVSDTGAGIGADQQQAIAKALRFSPDRPPIPEDPSALGLALCAHLVHRMRGEISVENEPGAAICFRFTARFLPLAEEALPPVDAEATARSLVNLALLGQNEPEQNESGPAAPLEILIAEDNAVNQKLVIRMLEHRGCRVVAANNGAQALALLAEKRFDLILMDIQMPAIDGFEATRAIRMKERETGEHIPIVALTAYVMNGDESRCLEAGMDGYLAKPVRGEDLARVIERFTRKSATIAD